LLLPFIALPFLSLIILNLPFEAIRRNASMVVAALALFQVASVLTLLNAPGAPDNLTLIALLCVGMVILVSLLVARSVLGNEAQKFSFMNLSLLSCLGMNGVILTQDFFSIYVFIEIAALSSFILIAMTKEPLAIEGSFKYIILSSVATVLMLTSIGLLLLFAGSTGFSDVATALKNSGNEFLFKIALGLFICGLFIKAGLVPFHGWLPDAYSAASDPVSVLLAGIVTKVSGVYVLLRLVVSVFGEASAIRQPLMVVGALSIVAGALLSLTQNNFKRLLAYSSISQVGYIILAAGCATPLAIFGAVFHFFNHAVFKSLLFVNAAAVQKQTGTVDMEKMGGLAARMPVTSLTSSIAFLSCAGIPPLAGFWSKLIIVIALMQSGNGAYAVIALLASVITLAYLLHLQRQVFFGKLKAGLEKIEEVSFGMALPQVMLAVIIVAAGLIFPWILKWK
jgi:multicomponent Na+:H+ antiporter subunit D